MQSAPYPSRSAFCRCTFSMLHPRARETAPDVASLIVKGKEFFPYQGFHRPRGDVELQRLFYVMPARQGFFGGNPPTAPVEEGLETTENRGYCSKREADRRLRI